MSTHTWTQPIYDKAGKLLGHFHHTDVGTPVPRTQQARQTTTHPHRATVQPSKTQVYLTASHAALACAGCGRITGCVCVVPQTQDLTAKIDAQIKINRQRQQGRRSDRLRNT
jgi:hypothetical protein